MHLMEACVQLQSWQLAEGDEVDTDVPGQKIFSSDKTSIYKKEGKVIKRKGRTYLYVYLKTNWKVRDCGATDLVV